MVILSPGDKMNAPEVNPVAVLSREIADTVPPPTVICCSEKVLLVYATPDAGRAKPAAVRGVVKYLIRCTCGV